MQTIRQQDILSVSSAMASLRNVRIILIYAAPLPLPDELGRTYSMHFINPNELAMPEVKDNIDSSGIDTIRNLYLKRLQAAGDTLTAQFVREAIFPIPAEYQVEMPGTPPGDSARVEAIEQLVPFVKTRAMLLRLETELDLPMREIRIGHTAVHSSEEIAAMEEIARQAPSTPN